MWLHAIVCAGVGMCMYENIDMIICNDVSIIVNASICV